MPFPINRRQFLTRTAALGALPLTTGCLSSLSLAAQTSDGDLTTGIQLWSVRREVNENPVAAIQQIASFGYKKVETAGFGGLSSKEFRKVLDDNGIACTGAHQQFPMDNLQATFDDANTLGSKYTGSGMLRGGTGKHPLPEGTEGRGAYDWMRAMTVDDAKATAELANKIGEAAKKEGLRYYYHNHPFEFVDLGNGATGYDTLMAETDSELVDFQLDCGWVVVARKNPIDILKQYPDRISALHIKNFLPLAADHVSDFQRRSTELSNGGINYHPVLEIAKSNNIKHIYVEQEDPFTNLKPMDAAKSNFEYLESLKNKYNL